MSDLIFVMFFLPVESMYIHYYLCRNCIPTISSDMCVSLILDVGLGLGSDTWCSDFLIEPGKNVEDLPRPSIVKGSIVSTQHVWF